MSLIDFVVGIKIFIIVSPEKKIGLEGQEGWKSAANILYGFDCANKGSTVKDRLYYKGLTVGKRGIQLFLVRRPNSLSRGHAIFLVIKKILQDCQLSAQN